MKLWKFNKITGYWFYVRSVTEETANQYLEIFQKDEPKDFFKISKTKPKEMPY